MGFQFCNDTIRQKGGWVIFAFTVPNNDLAVFKIDVLDAQAHAFHTCTGMQVQVSAATRCHIVVWSLFSIDPAFGK
jgi:hypothetical protein